MTQKKKKGKRYAHRHVYTYACFRAHTHTTGRVVYSYRHVTPAFFFFFNLSKVNEEDLQRYVSAQPLAHAHIHASMAQDVCTRVFTILEIAEN